MLIAVAVIYAIAASGGHWEILLWAPVGLARFYQDCGVGKGVAFALMLPSYAAAMLCAVVATLAPRVNVKLICSGVLASVLTMNAIGCRRMGKDFSGLTNLPPASIAPAHHAAHLTTGILRRHGAGLVTTRRISKTTGHVIR